MTIDLRKKANIDYLLVFLLAAVSGMPFFDGDIPLLGAFGLALLVFILRKDGFHRFYFLILFAFIILVLLHSLRFNNFPMNTYIGMVVKISLGYLVVATVNKDFVRYYVNMIVFFSVVSFFFFIPLLISDSFDNVFNAVGLAPPFEPGGTRKSLILYQLNLDRPGGLYRNCGPFWEPAAWGGYLILALVFNLALTKNLKDRKSVILIITLISTFSTTVFLLLAILFFFYFFVNQKLIFKIITVPAMLGLFYLAFIQLPFLKEKIEEELDRGDLKTEMKYNETIGHTRLSSAIADYQDFIEYPVIGRGLYSQTFYDATDTKARHNGLTKQIAQFGIVGAIIYFLSMYISMAKLIRFSPLNNFMGTVAFILILGMGMAEGYFDKPYFWGLVFLHLVINPAMLADQGNTQEKGPAYRHSYA
jgi:hypothetical protein